MATEKQKTALSKGHSLMKKAQALQKSAGKKTIPAKQVFKMNRAKAQSIAAGRLYSKNRSGSMDGVADIKKMNKLAGEIQAKAGKKTIPARQVYKMNIAQALKKVAQESEAGSKAKKPKSTAKAKGQTSLFGAKKKV